MLPRPLVAAVVAGASLLPVLSAHAAVESFIEWQELVEDTERDSQYTKVSTEGRKEGNRPLQWHYPVLNLSSANTRGHVSPQNHTLGGYAIADTSYRELAAPADSPVMWQNTSTRSARLKTGFTDTITVGAGTSGLQHGDTVQLKLTVRLDGVVRVGNPKINPGSSGGYAYGATSIGIFQQTEATSDEDASTPGALLANAWAEAEATQSTWWNQWSSGWDRTFVSGWGFWSNTMEDDHAVYAEDDLLLDYPEGEYDGSLVTAGYLSTMTVDTGVQELIFTTTVGAVLRIESDLLVHATAGYDSSYATANFLNTTTGSLSLVEGFEGLDLVYASATVPEPAALSLLSIGLLTLLQRRR